MIVFINYATPINSYRRLTSFNNGNCSKALSTSNPQKDYQGSLKMQHEQNRRYSHIFGLFPFFANPTDVALLRLIKEAIIDAKGAGQREISANSVRKVTEASLAKFKG
ncbi:hypothetical protein Golomagni_00793 [Golovinomyces magnicellulatus]|nr:hypothetical protein Golomagni_00793 [Golovinomyces magnicellulatus]